MRSLLPLAVLTFAVTSSTPVAVQSAVAAQTLADAQKLAANEGKPVLVDFFASW